MQTSKTRNGTSDGPQRTSPATPRTRASRNGDNDPNSATSATPTKLSTERSPKVIDRRSPRSPVTEKKRPGRITELESQINQLQEDLKKAKDQLSSSETWKKKAQQEAEEAKKQLQAVSTKLDDSQRQLVEFSAAEETRLQELRKISQERDRAWQSELEAIQKQHSVDSAALSSAMNEIQRLKSQLEMVLKSEASHLKHSEIARSELQALREDMAETLATVENLKVELGESRKAEAEAHVVVSESKEQLQVMKTTIETLRSDGHKLNETLTSTVSELEESKARVRSLEVITSLQDSKISGENGDSMQTETTQGNPSEQEVEQLRSALEEAEIKHQEEQIQSTVQMSVVHEVMEQMKHEYSLKAAEIEFALKNATAEIMKLKAGLVDKEAEIQHMAEMHKDTNLVTGVADEKQEQNEPESQLLKLTSDVTDLKSALMDKETELQGVMEENEMLKSEISKKDMENRKSYEAVIAELDLAKAAEQDVLLRLGYVTEEADKTSRRAARVAEQLDAAQAVNSEMEAELKRLRIQTDQWRKAAEAAAAVLTTGNDANNGRLMERTGSLDSDYNSIAGRLMSSPFSDELDDESPKKKNSNVLKKIGGLWKKSPK